MIGVWQLVLVLLIVFTIFGTGKLPSVMKDIGKGIKNLRQGLAEVEEDVPYPKQVQKLKKKKSVVKHKDKNKKSPS